MCFSFEISLGTGIFAWISCIYLLQKDLNTTQRHNIYYLLIFSTMQFADAILWYIRMKKNNINHIITSYIIPLILSLLILYNVYIRNKTNNKVIHFLALISIIYLFNKFHGYSISSSSNKLASPIWGSSEIRPWEMILFLLIMYSNLKLNLLNIFNIALFLIIYVTFTGGFGSLWCSLVVSNIIYYLYKY